jgi:phosphoglycolate phosphatase
MDGEAAARATIASLGIGDDLAFVCGFDSGYGIKPGPGMAEAFIAEVGVAPEDVVMVGDAVKDLQMGLAAGCGLRVGVLTGAADRAELAPHADHVLASIATLPEVL